MGEVEKNRFTTWPGERGHSGLALSKNYLSQPGRFGEEVYSNGFKDGVAGKIALCAGPALF